VLVDVEPEFLTMDPAKLEAAITPRTKAIIPVHLFGQPADMDPIMAIARKHKLVVIEDACQAHGSEYKGKRCGSIGQIGCFSFYPGKNLGAYGEGGAVVTSDPDMAKKIRLLRAWGEETRYEHKYRGFNYRMDGVQGAILGVKLRHLEAWTEARRRNASEYGRRLADTPAALPRERAGVRHVYHLYVVRLQQRDVWRDRLNEAGVQTGVHYPIPVHLQPAYRDLGYSAGDFPVCEQASREVLSLPMFPELTEAQIGEVASALRTSVGVGS
jgi:dTDP-4-amino-4,6-dideoxygalactose transaminase